MENVLIILVVEDDPLVRTVVEDALTEGGYKVIAAQSGEDAVKLLDASEHEYRALVTDINLGRDRLTGWAIARHARELNHAFPVVYMSGESSDDWAVEGVPNSIMLAKPFAPAQLVTAVSQLLTSATTPGV